MDEKKVREAIGRLQVGINAEREMIMHNKAFFQKQDNSYLESDIEVYCTAIEALEKQLPQKVEVKEWSPARCPSCGTELSESLGDGYYMHPTFLKRCPNVDCSQLLDWSE